MYNVISCCSQIERYFDAIKTIIKNTKNYKTKDNNTYPDARNGRIGV